MKKMRRPILGIIFLGVSLAIRVNFEPNVFSCVIFWSLNLGSQLLWGNYFLAPGIICNALAMIMNGGYMPVFGQDLNGIHGDYIAGNDQTALPLLCDRFNGASVGDILLGLGVLYWLTMFLLLPWMRSRSIHET
jgi:hypothetical protein